MGIRNAEMPAMPFEGGENNGEAPAKGLTKREHACIHLRIPDTGDKELDALIAKAQRLDTAKALYSGMLACHDQDGTWSSDNCWDQAIQQADGLIADLKRTG